MPKGMRTSRQQAKWSGSVSARTPSKSKRMESNATISKLNIIYVIGEERSGSDRWSGLGEPGEHAAAEFFRRRRERANMRGSGHEPQNGVWSGLPQSLGIRGRGSSVGQPVNQEYRDLDVSDVLDRRNAA